MSALDAERLRQIKTLPSLIKFLGDELEWPVEADEIEDATFDYTSEELGLDSKHATPIKEIKQLRPLDSKQPWGIFFIKFGARRLPIVALRGVLRSLVKLARQKASATYRPTWDLEDLLFICLHKHEKQNAITFVHFAQPAVEGRAPRLTSFGWTPDSHNRTVLEFNLPPLRWPHDTTQLADWRNQWLAAFDVEKVTKQFFREIANWYFWALKHVRFPKDAPKKADGRDHVSVIRLITRLIFCWFVKEKGLIPGALFDEHELAQTLNGFAPDKNSAKDSVFYRAILQNLFFATLNTEMDKRGWARKEQNFMAHSLYRHKECFRKPGKALELFKNIPFLNGGLFECLDRDLGEGENPRYVRIDGFSRRPDSQPVVPDFLLFGAERDVDLSADYGQAKYKRAPVRGLIHTLNRYNFTVEENTPLDQQVALDPELSGKVFENLLAAYNPETGATARKQTGSFYTPREIVAYMVGEALLAYLKTKLETAQASAKDVEPRLRQLFAYDDDPHAFTAQEVDALIAAIDSLRALDPAVGSGAFPMGILHGLVFILGKLDPRNEKWKERQVQRVRDAIATADKIEDAALRERTVRELEQQIAGVNEAFERNELDYGRKLYLIENCIYGVDIQPIAVQIAKMRFFISLIVDQKTNRRAPNLGVRPLPNLETKFVAANTLIGVNRPGQQLLRNLDIDAKEAELRRVRERHFNARTLATKAKYREQDARLRAEIAEMLKDDGWDDKTAQQLSDWDPYDQNASSDFFDPEWMFGLSEGFDIAIGNPPYSSKQSKDTKIYRAFFECVEYKCDPYAFFIEFAWRAVKRQGAVALIVPVTWMTNVYYEKLRRRLIDSNSLLRVHLIEGLAFKSANVDTSLLFLLKGAVESEQFTWAVTDPEISSLTLIPRSYASVRHESRYDIVPKVDEAWDGIRAKIESNTRRLGSFSKISLGMKLSGNDRFIAPARDKQHPDPIVFGKDVSPYGDIKPVRFFSFASAEIVGGTKNPDVHKTKNKILVQAIRNLSLSRRIVATLDTRGLCFVGTVNAVIPNEPGWDLYYLLGLMNSTLLNAYFRHRFTTISLTAAFLGELPIEPPTSNAKCASTISELVQKRLNSQFGDATGLEREIDQLVYALYGLTADEIKLVEESSRG